MTVETQNRWNTFFNTEIKETFEAEGGFALSQVRYRPALAEIRIICAEAFAELGDYEKALVHLRNVDDDKHSLDRNLLAIAKCLRSGGFGKEASECSDAALRITRRTFREADYQYGSIGELCRTYAQAALSTGDKGKARSVKRSARALELFFSDGRDCSEETVEKMKLAYDVEGALVAAGAIYHGGFVKHGIRALDSVAKVMERVLIIADRETSNMWLQMGGLAALLYSQMGQHAKAERFGLLLGHACSRMLLPDSGIGAEDIRTVDEDLEDGFDFEDSLETHDKLRVIREQGLIGIATGIEGIRASAVDNLKEIMDDLEKEEDIDPKALLLFALSIESEISSEMTAYERSLWTQEIENQLGELEEFVDDLANSEDRDVHPADLSELGLSIIASYYCLKPGEIRDRILSVSTKLADIEILELRSLDAFLTVSQFASIVDDATLDAKEGTSSHVNLTMLLSDKAREIFREHKLLGNFISDCPELIGGASDEALDLDSNSFLVERLASMGLYDEARSLATFTSSDVRAVSERTRREGSSLETIWVSYLSGVFASLESSLVLGKGVQSLPANSEQWLKYRG